jgi:L-aminopeptidase/D-esterase-like protein
LDKERVSKVAQMAHDGLARVFRPAHTLLDGGLIFLLATGDQSAEVNIVGAFAQVVLKSGWAAVGPRRGTGGRGKQRDRRV